MDVHLQGLAAQQADIVAGWQLEAVGWNRARVDHRVRRHGWRVVHPGVYALTQAPLTRRQRWLAATLTAPDCVLSHASAGACWGVRPFDGNFETVTRPGDGGPRRFGGMLVSRSRTLKGDTTRTEGIRITTVERTLIDLAPHVSAPATGRAFREGLRLKLTTAAKLRSSTERHTGRRGTKVLAELATRYATVPYARTRSDAEGRALELLHDGGEQPPAVNARIGGEEADLVWRERRLIVEIDGPQYHRFRDENARKERLWEAAGYTVRRVASDVVYERPERFLARVREPLS